MTIGLHRPKLALTLVALLTVAAGVRAQRTISTRNLFWGSVVCNYELSERWTIVSDGLFRVEFNDGDLFQSGIRAGLRYKTTNGFQWTAGGCAFLHYPNPNGRPARPELRSWQEFSKRFNFGVHHTFFPRVRLEQRFIKEYDGDHINEVYDFHSWRLRIRAEYFYAIGTGEDQRWTLLTGDEILFQQRGNGFSSLDQNRAWAGFACKFSPVFTAQLTYLHILQERSRTVFDQFHVLRLTLQFSLKRRVQNDNSQK